MASGEKKRGLEAGDETLRVLVVDDGRNAADILSLFFEMEGHEVRAAYDGAAGVKFAANFRPHLILMDISMPGMDGLEAARRIRKLPGGERVAIVALTGYDDEKEKRSCKQAGFDLLVAKPVCPEDLRDLVESFRKGELEFADPSV